MNDVELKEKVAKHEKELNNLKAWLKVLGVATPIAIVLAIYKVVLDTGAMEARKEIYQARDQATNLLAQIRQIRADASPIQTRIELDHNHTQFKDLIGSGGGVLVLVRLSTDHINELDSRFWLVLTKYISADGGQAQQIARADACPPSFLKEPIHWSVDSSGRLEISNNDIPPGRNVYADYAIFTSVGGF
jgi:hypothetical protein